MREQVWKVYSAAVAVAIGIVLVFPTDGWAHVWWQVAIGYSAVAAILVGLRRADRGSRAPWLFFAIGVFGNTTGILIEQVDMTMLHGQGFPSVADFFYLSLYPAVALGLGILIYRRNAGRDWGALVDATTVTTGLGLLAWIYMIRLLAADPTL